MILEGTQRPRASCLTFASGWALVTLAIKPRPQHAHLHGKENLDSDSSNHARVDADKHDAELFLALSFLAGDVSLKIKKENGVCREKN